MLLEVVVLACVSIVLGSEGKTSIRVGIIGGGIGSASTAYFLSKLIPGIHIDVFEKDVKVGGRVTDVMMNGYQFDAGASVIHIANKYAKEWTQELGLETTSRLYKTSKFAVFDGRQFVFQTSDWEIVNIGKILMRYGLGARHLDAFAHGILAKFLKIYELQDNNICFSNTSDFMKTLDLQGLDQVSIESALLSAGIPSLLISELVEAIMRVNYNQGVDIHAFVGAVSLMGSSEDLWAIKGGNRQLVSGVFGLSGAHVKTSSPVTRITKVNDNTQFRLEVNGTITSPYDCIILAAPLAGSGIESDINLGPQQEYQVTHVTFVRGKINASYFGYDNADDVPAVILTTRKTGSFFSSIGRMITEDRHYYYKVFSQRALGDNDLAVLFNLEDDGEDGIRVIRRAIPAYPVYTGSASHPSFVLNADPPLLHLSPIELAASAIEMSAIGGRNVAILAAKYLQQLNNDVATKGEL